LAALRVGGRALRAHSAGAETGRFDLGSESPKPHPRMKQPDLSRPEGTTSPAAGPVPADRWPHGVVRPAGPRPNAPTTAPGQRRPPTGAP